MSIIYSVDRRLKKLKVRTLSYAIIFLLCGMMSSNVIGLTFEQTYLYEDIFNPSLTCESSDILEMIEQVNESILRMYVQKIQDFGPHPTGSQACEAVGEYLYDTLNSFQISVHYEPWTYKLHSGKNIVGSIPGKDSGDIVVVTAHYDSVAVSPGADDDGSGVAAVLATADIMSHYSFNSTVRFVLFSGEEQGLLGSHEYVENAYENGENIIADLNLDGIGYALTTDDGSKIKHFANNQSSWMVDISNSIASQYHDKIGLQVIGLPHVTFSDHQSFVEYDYDASYFLEYLLTPYYHTSQDTLEHVNITYLAKVCRLSVGTLASIAELHPRLTDKDLTISIQGTVLAYPSQFYVRIDNQQPVLDTANVTINIAIKNLWNGEYVTMMKDGQDICCNWSFTEEIESFWEFKESGAHYANQGISVDVTVKGIEDDITLYSKQHTIGILAAEFFFVFPKL